MNSTPTQSDSTLSRRQFLQSGSTALPGATLLGALPVERSAYAAGGDLLKIALVGCGGRGSGAANQALKSAGNTKLVAMADVLPEKLAKGLAGLQTQHADKVMSRPTASSPTSTAIRKRSPCATW